MQTRSYFVWRLWDVTRIKCHAIKSDIVKCYCVSKQDLQIARLHNTLLIAFHSITVLHIKRIDKPSHNG